MSNLICPEKCCAQKIKFRIIKEKSSHKTRNFWAKKILLQKIFWSENLNPKYFLSKNILVPNFGVKRVLNKKSSMTFLSKNEFMSKKQLWVQKFWSQNFLLVEIWCWFLLLLCSACQSKCKKV